MVGPQRVFTTDQVAERWQCSANHVRHLIQRGELRAFKLGSKIFRVSAEAIEEFERRNEKEQAAVASVPAPALVPYDAPTIVLERHPERKPRGNRASKT